MVRSRRSRPVTNPRRWRRRAPPPGPGIWLESGIVTTSTGDVGEQLHQQSRCVGDTSAGDDLVDGDPCSMKFRRCGVSRRRPTRTGPGRFGRRRREAEAGDDSGQVASPRIVRFPFHRSSATRPLAPGARCSPPSCSNPRASILAVSALPPFRPQARPPNQANMSPTAARRPEAVKAQGECCLP